MGALVLTVWCVASLLVLAVEMLAVRRRRRGAGAPAPDGRLQAIERTLLVARAALAVLLAAGVVLAVVALPGRLG